ncbi:nitrate reductase [Solemya velum gill symbiont]|uniref:respiratory nitrate reductase subunit gamma n=1 Tax=Solemya velum gill symbiont TaxID=2340 RepID=UPI000997EC33|nr:nitrate reductase [Solemya velum gill symbiont]OOZ28158.1 nitrate reductase [Solemya velum gill symbiont]
MSVAYAILFYIALAILVIGVARRVIMYAKAPAPLKIPTTPAPTTQTGVVMRLFREVVFFESLFKSTKWTWIFGWMFHIGLFAVLARHSRYFNSLMPAEIVGPLKYAAFAMIIGLVGLLIRRFAVDRVRYISSPSDFAMLFLLILIGVSGAMMTFVSHTDITMVTHFFFTLMWPFDGIGQLPGDILVWVHLLLVALLMIIFPVSKLLHAPGVFFSPSRNQVDNPREQRHISDWAKKLEQN